MNFNAGCFGSKSTLYSVANQQYMKSKLYSYFGRQAKKRVFRKLWISRISSTLRQFNIKYCVFLNKMKKSSIFLDRKIFTKLLLIDISIFKEIVRVEM